MTDHELTKTIMSTMRMHRRVADGLLSQTGIHQAQHRLLMGLSHQQCNSQVELAKHMEVSPATVAVSLKALEKEGYIARNSKEEDNRFNHIEITPKGQSVVEESKIAFHQIDTNMFQGLSQEEKDSLSDMFRRIRVNLEDEISKKGCEVSEKIR